MTARQLGEVVIESTLGNDLTWNNSERTWQSEESWNLARFPSAFVVRVLEPVSIVGSASRRARSLLVESFYISETKLTKRLSAKRGEPLAVAEVDSRRTTFKRSVSEAIEVVDAEKTRTCVRLAEAIALYDTLRREADMVISDMFFSEGDMSETDFRQFMLDGNAPGYESWRDFIPGDYEYRRAMFRAVIESINSDRGLLTEMQTSVDVADVIDRGSASVTDANLGVTIFFSRKFHVVPEITLAMRGGVGSEPKAPAVVYVDREKFTVALATLTGAKTTGAFAWAAHGY